MIHPVSFRGILEIESFGSKSAIESFITVVSFWINESLAGTAVESEPF